jgi:hypothetical protein
MLNIGRNAKIDVLQGWKERIQKVGLSYTEILRMDVETALEQRLVGDYEEYVPSQHVSMLQTISFPFIVLMKLRQNVTVITARRLSSNIL